MTPESTDVERADVCRDCLGPLAPEDGGFCQSCVDYWQRNTK